MATTTISINQEAYERLVKLKEPRDSFSDVILRKVRVPADTCGELLDRLEANPPPKADVSRLQRGRRSRRPRG